MPKKYRNHLTEAQWLELKALVTAGKAAAPKRLRAQILLAADGDVPGPVEPFTLTVKQLQIVRACWNEVQGFLSVNGIGESPGQVHHESSYKASPDSKAPRRPAP